MRQMVKEEAGGAPFIWSVGRFSGGHVHNVVADLCELDISFRFYDLAFARRVEARVRAICDEIARRFGGKVELDWHMSTGPVINDGALIERFHDALRREGMEACEIPSRMSSEDFGWYLDKAPGMLFRFGTRNEAAGCTSLAHCNDFCIDESGMREGIRAFIAYVMHAY